MSDLILRTFTLVLVTPHGPFKIRIEAPDFETILSRYEEQKFIDGIEPDTGQPIRWYEKAILCIGVQSTNGGLVRAAPGLIVPGQGRTN